MGYITGEWPGIAHNIFKICEWDLHSSRIFGELCEWGNDNFVKKL